MAHIKAQDPIKGMSQEVRWMSLIINHNCRKTDLASKDGRRGDLGVEGEQPPIYVNHSLPSGLLLLREAINLSGNRVTHAQTKEHFGDVQQVLRQMTLIRLLLTQNLPKGEQSSLSVHECPPCLDSGLRDAFVSLFCLHSHSVIISY